MAGNKNESCQAALGLETRAKHQEENMYLCSEDLSGVATKAERRHGARRRQGTKLRQTSEVASTAAAGQAQTKHFEVRAGERSSRALSSLVVDGRALRAEAALAFFWTWRGARESKAEDKQNKRRPKWREPSTITVARRRQHACRAQAARSLTFPSHWASQIVH